MKILVATCLLLLAGCWYLASLKNPAPPSLLQWADVRLVAHRGGMYHGPENSLLAFDVAKKNGADAVEFDIYLTSDDVAVLMHDISIDRTTNGSGLIQHMLLADLQNISITTHAELSAPIPTLEQAIQHALQLQLKMVIEVKETLKRQKMVDTLILMFEQYQLYNVAVVGAFDPVLLYQLRRKEPRVPTLLFFLHRPISTWCAISRHQNQSALPRFLPPPPLIQNICASTVAPTLVDGLVDWLNAGFLPSFLGVSVVAPQYSLVSPLFIRSWAQAGVLTNAWVVNSMSSKQFLIEHGALVTTDCPDSLVTCLTTSHSM